ncbi:MAG: transposase [Myxococcota bacterium]|jgi:transposase
MARSNRTRQRRADMHGHHHSGGGVRPDRTADKEGTSQTETIEQGAILLPDNPHQYGFGPGAERGNPACLAYSLCVCTPERRGHVLADSSSGGWGVVQLGAGKQTEVILVVDQAESHFGKTVTVPPGIHLLLLPPHSPELQPAERHWEIADEAVTNQVFDDIEDLEIVFAKRFLELMERTDEIKARTNLHWW